jgi:hypothetical protein
MKEDKTGARKSSKNIDMTCGFITFQAVTQP